MFGCEKEDGSCEKKQGLENGNQRSFAFGMLIQVRSQRNFKEQMAYLESRSRQRIFSVCSLNSGTGCPFYVRLILIENHRVSFYT